MNTYDLEFLSRMMGAPAHLNRTPGDGGLSAAGLQTWVETAAANPAKRGQAPGRIAVLLDELPTEETAARTPVEPVRPATVESPTQDPQGECACESGLPFRDCHGADSMADEKASG